MKLASPFFVHNRTRRTLVKGALGAAAVGAFPGSAFAQAKKLGSVEYAVASIDPVYAMAYTAFKKGYFSDAGLDVKYLNAQSGPRAKQMLAAGQIFMATSGASDSVALTIAGKPSVLVAAIDARVPWANILTSKKLYDAGLKDIKGLAGKSIGVTQPQSSTWLMATYLADKAGLKDKVQIKPLGDLATMLGAVKSGSVECCMATFPMIDKAKEEGWGVPLFDITDSAAWNAMFGGEVPGAGCYVLQESIDKRPEAVQALVTGLVRAAGFIKDASPEEIAQTTQDYTAGFSTPLVVRAVTVFKKTWSFDNLITKESYDRMMSIMEGRQFTAAELAAAPYAKAVNMSFVRAARKT